MSVYGSQLFPFSVNHFVDADAAADAEWNIWRAYAACQVDAVYAVMDAAVATKLLEVVVGKKSAGTGTLATIAQFATSAAWAADTPRTGTLTAANTKLAAGDWLTYKRDETGAGTETRLALHVYLFAGYEN